MPWVKLDDSFADHPKVEQVGPLSAWLHVAALCYCARHLTDGVIPKVKAARLTDVPQPTKRIQALIDAGMWHDEGDHYQIHDYLDYQPSREQVETERGVARKRMSDARQRKRSPEHPPNVPANFGECAPVGSPYPDPTRPVEVLSTTAAACTADQRQERLAAAAGIIGERAATRMDARNPTAVRRAVAKGVITDRHTEAYAIIAADPSITAADLAEQLEPTPPAVPEPYNISSHLLPVDDVVPWGGQHWEEGATALADIRAERGWAKPATNPGASHA